MGQYLPFGLEHILNATIFTHLQPIQRFALKHMVIAQFFQHLVDNPAARERLATDYAAKWLLFIEYTGAAPSCGIEYVACRQADRILGAGCFAKAALHAVPFEKI